MLLTPNGRFELNTKVCTFQIVSEILVWNRLMLLIKICISFTSCECVFCAVTIRGFMYFPSQITRSFGSLHGESAQVSCSCLYHARAHKCQVRYSDAALVAIIGLQGFFPLKGQAAIGVGSLEVPSAERRRLASLCVVRSSHHPDCPRLRLVCSGHETGRARAAITQTSIRFQIHLNCIRPQQLR